MIIVILCFFQLTLAQKDKSFKNNALVDSVHVERTLDETFMIYFPKKNNSNILPGVVFIFDPRGRGIDGIRPFVAAAEKYNFLLVCSNNSKNGPIDSNKEIAFRLFDFVFNKYSINKKKIIVAGFSGGARLAGNLALNTGIFNGVVACGASFQPLDVFIPKINDFSYIGMVGRYDMNYQEMIKNVNWLNRKKIDNQLLVSDDEHVWPSDDEVLRAFDWLEIVFQRKGFTEKNQEILKEIYQKNLSIANSFLEKKEFWLALHEFERLRSEFKDWDGNNVIQLKIEEIKKNKFFLKSRKRMIEIEDFEESLMKECELNFVQNLENVTRKNRFEFWVKLNKDLNKITKKTEENIENLRMLKRISSRLKTMISVAAQDFVNNGQQQKYVFCNNLLEILKF